MRIVVVDHELSATAVLRSLLTAKGHEVILVTSAVDVVQMVFDSDVDMVLVNGADGGVDSEELYAMLRARGYSLPVISVRSLARPEWEDDCG